MTIHPPLCITSRLLPGVRIGDAWISIEYADWPGEDGRQRYTWYIENGSQSGESYESDDLQSGAGGGTLQEGLESLLGFLGAFASAIAFREREGKEAENADLFPADLAEWAVENADEITMLECELLENPGELIVED
jgi:hypothetical protein